MAKQKTPINHSRKVVKPTKLQHSPLCSPQQQYLDTEISIFDGNNQSSLNQITIPSPKKLKFTIDSLLKKVVNNTSTVKAKENYSGATNIYNKSKQLSGLQVDIPENSIAVPASQPFNCSKLLKSAETKNNNKLEKSTDSRSQEESTSPLQQLPNWAPPGNPCSSTDIGQLECRLDAENKVLWKNFDKIGTEMIITKPGRRMFPTVKVRVENCNPEAMYYVYLDCIPVDGHRYRYVYTKSSWCNSGKADGTPPSRLYMHPDSPFSGAQLITSPTISFEKAKLTNNLGTGDKDPLLILNSMHKYQPRVHILQRLKSQTPLEHGGQNVVLQRYNGRYKSFQFKETRFMAVTAYQNQLVTKMKIKNNPFAKGFRETDKSDSNSISHRDGHLDAFNSSSSYSLPSPSLMNTSYLSAQPQLPVNSLVTFAQIAPLALAAIQHLPPNLRPPPPMVPPASWSVPWIKLSLKEQQSFLFYYQLTSSLTMQLANCSGASMNKESNILETEEIKGPETTEASSLGAKRRSHSPSEENVSKQKREKLDQCSGQLKADSSCVLVNRYTKVEEKAENVSEELQEVLI